MILYHFARLIKKYGVSCVLKQTGEGRWEAGEYIPGATLDGMLNAAILPMADKKIYDSGGYYKTADRELYTLEEIDTSKENHVVHRGQSYKVESNADYTDYADFHSYVLKWVSKFDRPEETE